MRPTTKSYRCSVAETIRNIQAQHGLTDHDLAEQIGCSVGTISNARNERGNLDGVFLMSLQYAFGADAIDPVLALSGARGVPKDATCSVDMNPVVKLAEAIQKLAEAQRPDSEHGGGTGPKEARDLLPVLRAARSVLDHEIARLSPMLKAVG
jgi:transcriptional regulator with XRE-family HTH domain